MKDAINYKDCIGLIAQNHGEHINCFH